MKLNEEKERRLKREASLIQMDVDHDWMYFEERVDAIEEIVESLGDNLIRDVLGFVVVQIYLHQIQRGLEDV